MSNLKQIDLDQDLRNSLDKGQETLSRLLIENGADISNHNYIGIKYALWSGHVEMVARIIKDYDIKSTTYKDSVWYIHGDNGKKLDRLLNEEK